MKHTHYKLSDILPLTCSRSGACCHGNVVRLNPWELAQIALAKGIGVRQFRDTFCAAGGVFLRFDAANKANQRVACHQYLADFGCTVHSKRPLACRLYPLGREVQNGAAQYFTVGTQFPCLRECPEVKQLPQIRVAEYLKGQYVDNWERAQDAYLEFMQNIADVAFALLLENGLGNTGDAKVISSWHKMSIESPAELLKHIDPKWIDALMIPNESETWKLQTDSDPLAFYELHQSDILNQAQTQFGTLNSLSEFGHASITMMGLAMYLGHCLGANVASLGRRWVLIAQSQRNR